MLGHRDHGERIGQPFCSDRRSLERIERDIDLRAIARAHLLADIQHRRFVAFAFADHHRTRDIQAVQRIPHGVDGDLIGHPFVPAAHLTRCRKRRSFGDAHHFQRQIAIHLARISHFALLPLYASPQGIPGAFFVTILLF